MDNENENLDSSNETIDVITEDDDVDALKQKYQTLSEKHTKQSDINRQLFTRAKKAEGFELKDGKWVKAEKKEPEKPPENKPKEEDYGLLTYLAQNGIETDEDREWAEQVKSETGKSWKDLLNTVYFQKELTERKEARATKEAIPSGTNRSGGSARDSVEYWLAKGELPPADQVELRRKVVDAKYARDTNASGKFTDHPIINFPSGM